MLLDLLNDLTAILIQVLVPVFLLGLAGGCLVLFAQMARAAFGILTEPRAPVVPSKPHIGALQDDGEPVGGRKPPAQIIPFKR